MATPYPPKGVHWHNIGQLKPFLVALSNAAAAGAGMASIPPVLRSNHQPLSLLNGKVLIDGSVCLSGDHPQVPEKAACTKTNGGMPVSLSPATPAKAKQVYGSIQHEMSKADQDGPICKESLKEAFMIPCCVNVLPDASELVAPLTPDKSLALESNLHRIIQSIDDGLNRDENVQEAASREQRFELPIPTPFSTDFNQTVDERVNIGRNPRKTKMKAAIRKKHRPKVLKDLPFPRKEPVIAKEVTRKKVKRKQKQSRSAMLNKNLNSPITLQKMARDASKALRIARKSGNQHSDNETKIVRRKLGFPCENQSIDEYPEEAFINPPIHLSRRELLKKNWKHLTRITGSANSTDKTYTVEVSKRNSIQSHVKLDGDFEMTLGQGEMEKQAKSCYNHVNNVRSNHMYPISSDKSFMQPQVSNIPQFPPECKRRRTMLMHNGEFGRMTRVSKLCSSVDEQMVSMGDLRTSDFMLTFGPTKLVTKKRSKVHIRARKSVFAEIVSGYKELLQNLESRHGACIEALLADTHMKMKTGKRTKRKHFNLYSTSDKYKPIYTDQCADMSQAIVPYMHQTYNYNVAEPQNALVSYENNTMVPYTGTSETKRKRLRAKVDLDHETNRVWNLLMGKMIKYEGSDPDREEQWEEQRSVFSARADSFIARMRLIQGDRQFSPWKGSVLDSVIGVFLTQNVSDHLSSSAFMTLAAKFPVKPRKDNLGQDTNRMSIITDEHEIITSSSMLCQQNSFGNEEIGLVSFFYHIDDGEGNKMHMDDDLGRWNIGDDDLENSGTNVNAQKRELELCPVTSDDKTETSTTIKTGFHLEDKRLLNEAASSLNSVSSSDSSSSSHFHDTNFVEFDLPIDEYPDPRNQTKITVLDSYALSQEHIDRSGISIAPEVYNQVHDGKISLDKSSTADQISENLSSVGRLKIMEDSCQETGSRASSLLNYSQLDTMSLLPDFTSEASDSDKMKNVNVRKTKSISGFMFSDPTKIKKDAVPVHRNCDESSTNLNVALSQQPSATMSNVTTSHDTSLSMGKLHFRPLASFYEEEDAMISKQSELKDCQAKNNQYEVEFLAQNHLLQDAISNSCNDLKSSSKVINGVENCSPIKFPTEASKGAPKAKNTREESTNTVSFDWDSLRTEACQNGYNLERSKDRMDSLDWEAVRHSDIKEIAETIKERGMNNMLAGRIKDFLNRLVADHGSLDLEWLRDVAPEKTKDYLLSIRGLGLKSAECVRLLTLHQHAFPVDTNVGRICVRLGWVPLKPLPESLQLHLLESYPLLETIQKYLWPRLCKLDQRTLYELHYQMITFGKVFCTKSKPNCNACPMRGECRHFASAWTSSRLLLGPEESGVVKPTMSNALENHDIKLLNAIPLCQNGENYFVQGTRHNDVPTIEEPPPPSPEPQCQVAFESEIEETYNEDPCEIPTMNFNLEEFTQNLQNYVHENVELPDGEIEKAIVALTSESASIPVPKLKNVKRLRTEHLVYELPDGHPLLEGLEKRENDDPCPYLLSIWAPGETAHSIEPPQTCCNHVETGRICEDMTCFSCSCRQEEQTQTIRATLLIPCRTANRGSFPLNGTYFQVNEVFADHESSHNPLIVPRRLIWNLRRRIVYFGTSIPTIFRGLSIEEIQLCFSRGFVCLRGFDRTTRAPKPLSPRLHLAASHAQKDKKPTHKDEKNAGTRTGNTINRNSTS
ncbi:DNA glycosylase/AP lyase ROS1-like [Curcuma longa]|uniref:DNA glycosylase/AP lyase ROS1-like n=1 Tax=Curcuma longa TaxID=136217 RepID=UPI003D9E7C3C